MSSKISFPRFYDRESQSSETTVYTENEIELVRSYNDVAYETVHSQITMKNNLQSVTASSTLVSKQICELIMQQKHELKELWNKSMAVKNNAENCFKSAILTNEDCKKRLKACEDEISTLTNTANYLQQQLNNLQYQIQRKQSDYNAEKEEYDRLVRRNERCRNVRIGGILGGLALSPLAILAPPVGVAIGGAVIATTAITAALEASQRRLNAISSNISALQNSLHQSQVEINEVTTKIQKSNEAKRSASALLENDSKKPELFHEIIGSLAKIENFIEQRQIPLDEILAYYEYHAKLPPPPTHELLCQQKINFLNRIRSICKNHAEVINTQISFSYIKYLYYSLKS